MTLALNFHGIDNNNGGLLGFYGFYGYGFF